MCRWRARDAPGAATRQECLKTIKRGALGQPDAPVQLIVLHSLQETESQQAALRKPTAGCIKVILATNIAESSITVADVGVVIDIGLEKLPHFDVRANTDTLLMRRCSRASATQRAGRAGRVAPGVCLRLYPKAFLAGASIMPAFVPAEMERTSLLNLILKAAPTHHSSRPIASDVARIVLDGALIALDDALIAGEAHRAQLAPRRPPPRGDPTARRRPCPRRHVYARRYGRALARRAEKRRICR